MSDFTLAAAIGPGPTCDGKPVLVMADSGMDTSVVLVVDVLAVGAGPVGPSVTAVVLEAVLDADLVGAEEQAETRIPAAVSAIAQEPIRRSLEVGELRWWITPSPPEP
jgi:hypothetical protein